jgi:hypothetical protein
MEVLITLKRTHGYKFADRVNVDLHSCGGWSPQFWIQAEVSGVGSP